MIIGRTMSKVFSTLEQICGRDTFAGEIFNALDYMSLPLASMDYWVVYDKKTGKVIKDNDGEIKMEAMPTLGYDKFQFSASKDVKRDLAKAFDKRRSVKIGETFEFEGGYKVTHFGDFKQDVTVEKLSDKTVMVSCKIGPYVNAGKYIVSSSKKELVKYKAEGGEPVLYKTVIF